LKRHIQKYHFICVSCKLVFNNRQEIQEHLVECSKGKKHQKIDLSFTEAFRRTSLSDAPADPNFVDPESSQEYIEDSKEDLSLDSTQGISDDSGLTSATDSDDTTLDTSGSSSNSLLGSSFNPNLLCFPNPFLLQMADQIQKQISESSSKMEISDDSVDRQPQLESVKQETPEVPAAFDPLEVARTIVFLRILQMAKMKMMILKNQGLVNPESVNVKVEPEVDELLEESGDSSIELEDSDSGNGSNQNLATELDQEIGPEPESGDGGDPVLKTEEDSVEEEEIDDSESLNGNNKNPGTGPNSETEQLHDATALNESDQNLAIGSDSGDASENPNDADLCNQNTKSELNFDQETEPESSAISNTCCDCNMAFPSALTLKSHQRRAHSRTVKCQECPRTFSSKSGLLFHHKRQHLKESFDCKDCDLSFSDSFSLIDHVRGIHEQSQSINCDKCEMVFPTKKSFYKHKYSEHTNNRWTCELCNAEFKAKFRLEQHQLNHHGK
jgi:hypothetical protein